MSSFDFYKIKLIIHLKTLPQHKIPYLKYCSDTLLFY